MRDASGVPFRPALTWALTIYAVCSLISMAAMSIAAVGVVAALIYETRGRLAGAPRDAMRTPRLRLLLLASALLAVACLASLIAASLDPPVVGGKPLQIHVVKDFAKAWYLAWAPILFVGLRMLAPERRSRVLRAWIIAFAVISVIGCAQFFTGWPRPQMIPGFEPRYHATLFLGHHLSVASVWIFPFFVALAGAIDRESARKLGLSRLFLAGAAFLGMLVLVATFSRMMWLALPAGLTLFAILSLKTTRSRVVVVLALLVSSGLASQVSWVQKRMDAGLGTGERRGLWSMNLEFFERRPIFGIGWNHTVEAATHATLARTSDPYAFIGHAHNAFIEMLSSTGLLGAAAWLFWVGVAGLIFFKADRFGPALFSAWVVFQLNGLTQVNFWDAKVLHQIMWALAWAL